ncbi:MAG: hypothetical protein EBU26_15785 [Verrucomicrobia bacterium]|nr:hypothetical protein [Verrucomicrobiota bacterium]
MSTMQPIQSWRPASQEFLPTEAVKCSQTASMPMIPGIGELGKRMNPSCEGLNRNKNNFSHHNKKGQAVDTESDRSCHRSN